MIDRAPIVCRIRSKIVVRSPSALALYGCELGIAPYDDSPCQDCPEHFKTAVELFQEGLEEGMKEAEEYKEEHPQFDIVEEHMKQMEILRKEQESIEEPYFVIYNWNDGKMKVHIDGEIKRILVMVLTGDEVIEVEYDGGEVKRYDAGALSGRMDFLDGVYELTNPESIKQWMEFRPEDNGEIYSYQRMQAFEKGRDDDDEG